MPIADGGTWLCWGWESGAKREGNGNQQEGGSRAGVNIKHIGESLRWGDRENEEGSDWSTGLNDVLFLYQRGVDEAPTGVGENVVINDPD